MKIIVEDTAEISGVEKLCMEHLLSIEYLLAFVASFLFALLA